MDADTHDFATTLSIPAGARSQPTEVPPHRYLVKIEGTSSSNLHLPAHGEVFIGRAPEAQVRVQDPTASRRHAKLTLTATETILTDLASHNGTQVNGQTISAARLLQAGDAIGICDATLVLKQEFQQNAHGSVADLRLLRQRLDEELDRAREYERALAVLCIRSLDAVPQGTEMLAQHLRRMDCLAPGEGSELFALLPEMDIEDATTCAWGILQAMPQSRIGVAVCPSDGADADLLLGAARAAVEAALTGQVIAASTLDTAMNVGEQSVIVADPAMTRLYELLRKLAQSSMDVLVCGETGAGKELAAAAIHHFSSRRTGPLITVNCAALSESLIESELFGHERGSFSGAVATKIGLFESAAGGTLFLDELGELPLSMQPKFLRALETKRITRVGATQERMVDVRVVAATNRDLEQEVKAGRFRQDLYYRLNGATVSLLPLRERRRELPLLARAFLADACAKAGRPPMTISPGAMHKLLAYSWPGNVRELRNTMDFSAATSSEPALHSCYLPERIRQPATANDASAPVASVRSTRFRPLEEELRELERRRMIEALSVTDGVQNRAAELLAMPLRTFASKIKLYGLSRRNAAAKDD